MASTAKCETTTGPATGHLEWEIDGWTGLPDKLGEGTLSETMQCVGDSWSLQVCPGGRCDEHKKHVGIFLYYPGSSEALRTDFSITIVNQLPGLQNKSFNSLTCTFGQRAEGDVVKGWGWKDFIKRIDHISDRAHDS